MVWRLLASNSGNPGQSKWSSEGGCRLVKKRSRFADAKHPLTQKTGKMADSWPVQSRCLYFRPPRVKHYLDIFFDPVFLLKLIGSRLYFCHNFCLVSDGLFTYWLLRCQTPIFCFLDWQYRKMVLYVELYKTENVSLKWELPALHPPSLKKEEYWSEDGCK